MHGIIATFWLVLHYTQARLIAAHRVALHKKLGIFTACVGALLAFQALNLGSKALRLVRAAGARSAAIPVRADRDHEHVRAVSATRCAARKRANGTSDSCCWQRWRCSFPRPAASTR